MFYENFINNSFLQYVATIIIILASCFAYLRIKRRISISSGKYSVLGEVTFSERGRFVNYPIGWHENAIYYKYYINNKLYTAAFNKRISLFRKRDKELINKYPPGAKEMVYYSINKPEFSTFGYVPSKIEIITNVIIEQLSIWFVLYLLVDLII